MCIVLQQKVLCDQYGNTLKPATVQDCNRHKGNADKTKIEMEEEIILSPSGYFNSEQFYSSLFLRFKTFSPKFQTCFD
jgi:hypothetical protein